MESLEKNSKSFDKIINMLRSNVGGSIDKFSDIQAEWEKNPYVTTVELLKIMAKKQEDQNLRINIANFFHRNEKYDLLNGANSKQKHPIKKMIIDSFMKIITDKSENCDLRKKIIDGFANGFLLFSPYSQSYKADVITALNNIAGDDCENKSIRKAAKETSEKKEKWIPYLYK